MNYVFNFFGGVNTLRNIIISADHKNSRIRNFFYDEVEYLWKILMPLNFEKFLVYRQYISSNISQIINPNLLIKQFLCEVMISIGVYKLSETFWPKLCTWSSTASSSSVILLVANDENVHCDVGLLENLGKMVWENILGAHLNDGIQKRFFGWGDFWLSRCFK